MIPPSKIEVILCILAFTGGAGMAQEGKRKAPPTEQSPGGGTTVQVEPKQTRTVALTGAQRRTLEGVLGRYNAPRVKVVDFPIAIGATVPPSVRVLEVPPSLVEIRPEWRGYNYFVLPNEIIILDKQRRVVAVLVV